MEVAALQDDIKVRPVPMKSGSSSDGIFWMHLGKSVNYGSSFLVSIIPILYACTRKGQRLCQRLLKIHRIAATTLAAPSPHTLRSATAQADTKLAVRSTGHKLRTVGGASDLARDPRGLASLPSVAFFPGLEGHWLH